MGVRGSHPHSGHRTSSASPTHTHTPAGLPPLGLDPAHPAFKESQRGHIIQASHSGPDLGPALPPTACLVLAGHLTSLGSPKGQPSSACPVGPLTAANATALERLLCAGLCEQLVLTALFSPHFIRVTSPVLGCPHPRPLAKGNKVRESEATNRCEMGCLRFRPLKSDRPGFKPSFGHTSRQVN